jgi:tetratricopeptide (TPR) repeat protein
MRTFKKKFEDGTATPYQVSFYFIQLRSASMDYQPAVNSYLMKQHDSTFVSPFNWKIIYEFVNDPTSPAIARLAKHKKQFEAAHTTDSVNNKIVDITNSYLMSFVRLKDSAGYESAKKKIAGIKGLDIADKALANADLNKYKKLSDWDQYKSSAKVYMDKFAGNDYNRINEIANDYLDHFTDMESLTTVEKWLKHSIAQADLYKSNHLMAYTYMKLGKKKEAMDAAKHAIEINTKNNVDYSQTTTLLSEIEKMP